jgi:outer membrane protein TolC
VLSACGDHTLSDIDKRIDKLVDRRSDYLGGGATSPEVSSTSPEGFTYEGVAEERPVSLNPAFDQLRYEPAPSINVEDRLEKLNAYATIPERGRTITLRDAWRIAQTSGREYLNAQEEYILAAIRLLIERHLWSPRFFNDTTVALDAVPTAPGGGDYEAALSVINSLRATQRLPYGGQVEAQWVYRATEQLRTVVTEDYTQSSQFILSGDLPLLRGAGLVARESLIQAERDLVYAARSFEDFRRSFLVEIAIDYFNLVLQQNNIRNQEVRLASVRGLEEQTMALVDAGRKRAFDVNNVRQNVLRSQDDLTSSRENYILALDRFKIRLGIPVEENVDLVPPEIDLTPPDVTPDEAARTAVIYRLDYQNEVDQLEDSRRAVANARNDLLPDLDLSGQIAFNTDSERDSPGLSFIGNETDLSLAATFSLPLDREIERLNLRAALIGYQQDKRSLDQFRDNIILDARQSVREIDRSLFSLDLQDEAIRLNELRVEELEIKADEVDPQERLDAENELLDSRNQRDVAVRDIRVAILQFLETTGQMRVQPDGAFQPLPGMIIGLNQPQQTDPGQPATGPDPNAQPATPPVPPT